MSRLQRWLTLAPFLLSMVATVRYDAVKQQTGQLHPHMIIVTVIMIVMIINIVIIIIINRGFYFGGQYMKN